MNLEFFLWQLCNYLCRYRFFADLDVTGFELAYGSYSRCGVILGTKSVNATSHTTAGGMGLGHRRDLCE